MAYLRIRGEQQKIPRFPHHKNFVYRCNEFFHPQNARSVFTADYCLELRQILRGFRYGCVIPRDLLIDPTSACNLRCKGCWAADYNKGDSLSYDKLDEIFNECEKLLITDILMTGGEPMIRREDIFKLARKHKKLFFGVFTNATLIDEKVADEIASIPNLTMFISIEGSKEETDFRRGEGTYDRCLNAMKLLKDRDVAFAFSTCYHANNYKTIASKEYIEWLQEQGAWMGWMFNYAPIGKDADLSLVCSPEQRAYVKEQIEKYCEETNFTIIDFWNMGHVATGCVAAANGFIHINAKGDVEPCAFCHYSDSNIHEMSLPQALQSPFFRAFRDAQPFSDNPLRSCPMIDVPEAIVEVTRKGNAHSTHYEAPETAEELASKTRDIANKWEPEARRLKEKLSPKWKQIFTEMSRLNKIRIHSLNNKDPKSITHKKRK